MNSRRSSFGGIAESFPKVMHRRLSAGYGGASRPTEETSSDILSEHLSSDGQYEIIEYDLLETNEGSRIMDFDISEGNNNNNNNDLKANVSTDGSVDIFQDFGRVSIEDDSPAAEALRANANVHVSSVGKAARAVHMQSVRRALKRAAGKSRTGPKKGKPPRLPPNYYQDSDDDDDGVLEEEDEDEDDSGIEDNTDDDNGIGIHKDGTITHPEMEYTHEQELGDHSSINDSLHKSDIQQQQQQQTKTEEYNGQQVQQQQKTGKHGINDKELHSMSIPDGVAPGTVQTGKEVLGSVDPHDLIKLARWKNKKKGKLKNNLKKSYVKGKVIDGEHELYTMSIAVMIGVRTSISRTNKELNRGPEKRWVRPSDFRTTEKYEFRPKGDGPLPPHQLAHTFKFKDYSPVVFAYMRRMYGINEFDFLLSVCGNANFIEFVSNSKSGQFFFYSSDGRYMIKTMTNAESKFLRRILPQYFKHCCENPNTMITRFFGMYRVKLYHLRRNVKFVIMNSVYYTDKHLQLFYDLKGSSVGRDAKPGQLVLKDNDLRRGLPDSSFSLRSKERNSVKSQLESDCDLLSQIDVMDYSMLVGVHHIPAFDGKTGTTLSFRKNKANKGGRRVAMGDESERSATSAGIVPSSPARDRHHRGGGSGGGHHTRNWSETHGPFLDGLEDDDDNSYLLGSEKHPVPTKKQLDEDTEQKKLVTIEKLFWPFQNWYNIHGHRRIQPKFCPTCNNKPCICNEQNYSRLLKGYNIPKFVPPLSDRRDGGFEMDTTGIHLPMKTKIPGGNDILCDGKIFYMGVIDILQEYTSRKALESTYRLFTAPTRLSASCVPPRDYGKRFINFFEEYTQHDDNKLDNDKEQGVEVSTELNC